MWFITIDFFTLGWLQLITLPFWAVGIVLVGVAIAVLFLITFFCKLFAKYQDYFHTATFRGKPYSAPGLYTFLASAATLVVFVAFLNLCAYGATHPNTAASTKTNKSTQATTTKLPTYSYSSSSTTSAAPILQNPPEGLDQQMPFEGMDEKWMSNTILGEYDKSNICSFRGEEGAREYLWYSKNSKKDLVFEATCKDGVVVSISHMCWYSNYWTEGSDIPNLYADGSPREVSDAERQSVPVQLSAVDKIDPADYDNPEDYADDVVNAGGNWQDAYTKWEQEVG